jgi:hypothetical protein
VATATARVATADRRAPTREPSNQERVVASIPSNFEVLDEAGRSMGTYPSREQAEEAVVVIPGASIVELPDGKSSSEDPAE